MSLTDECHRYDLDGNPVEPISTHPWKPLSGWWAAYRNPDELVGFGSTQERAINDFLELEAERV